MRSDKTLFVILKTVERCNLNCSYCYFFNRGDLSFKDHPPFIKRNTVIQLVKFLEAGVADLGLSRINIILHGGEPTLQPLNSFEFLCAALSKLSTCVQVRFCIQTNGTLINARWISAFAKYDISVGVSLDGPREYNDAFRLDHLGKSSYQLTENGVLALNKEVTTGRIKPIAALCVIDPKRDPRVIYRHFVDRLKFKQMDFLLPDFTHDDFNFADVGSYGDYLCALFDEWIRDGDPNIQVRFFESILNVMVGKSTVLTSVGPDCDNIYALTVSSNGELSPDDTLRSANGGKLMQCGSIWKVTLRDFFQLPIFDALKQSQKNLPMKCRGCGWQKVCNGGFYIHRYSRRNDFDNPSLMCEALKRLYRRSAAFLLANGLSVSELESTMLHV